MFRPIILLLIMLGSADLYAGPNVVATIAPVHSLVSGVMKGVGEPSLLLRGFVSPHAYSLRPSEARDLERADVVFWVGPNLETFLEKALRNRRSAANVALGEASGVVHLAARAGGVWESEHADGHEQEENHKHGLEDPHVWLDPRNARAMIREIVAALSRVDPENRPIYQANGQRRETELADLEKELSDLLEPVREQPYIVFHDAYRYFEQRFSLASAGAVSLGPDRNPSARRIRDLRAHIQTVGARCVFREPQFESRLVDVLREDLGMRVGILDPLGGGLPPGPELYSRLLRDNARALLACLHQEPPASR